MEKPLPSLPEPGEPLRERFYPLHPCKYLTGISAGQRHSAQGCWCLDEEQSRDPGVPGHFSASLCSKGIALGLASPVPGSSITRAGAPASPTLSLSAAEHCSQCKAFSLRRVWVLQLTPGCQGCCLPCSRSSPAQGCPSGAGSGLTVGLGEQRFGCDPLIDALHPAGSAGSGAEAPGWLSRRCQPLAGACRTIIVIAVTALVLTHRSQGL